MFACVVDSPVQDNTELLKRCASPKMAKKKGKLCLKTDGCVYDKKSKSCLAEPALTSAACSSKKLLKEKGKGCKKTAGCKYDKKAKACTASAASPSPTSPANEEAAKLSKKAAKKLCKKAKSKKKCKKTGTDLCKWKKGKCAVKA